MSDRYINLWLVRKINWLGQEQFYRIQSNGNAATTADPKRAMRWIDADAAAGFAARLGNPWEAVLVKFKGDEPVVVVKSTDLDDLLQQSLLVFIAADYHPFNGIEQAILGATKESEEYKKDLLHSIVPMLLQSDYEEAHELAEEIQSSIASVS